MAKKISDLTSAAALTGSELMEVVQSAGSFKLLLSTLKTWMADAFTGGNLTSALNEAKGADIASGATTDIGGAGGNYVNVTGTTTITALGTTQAGAQRVVRFAGALTLTHNATSLILPTGANITTAANDIATFVSEGAGNWRCIAYSRADGTSLGGSPGSVTSVNGRSGAVSLTSADVPSAVTPLAIATGVVVIDCSLGNFFTLALTENVTSITFSNLPAAGSAQAIAIRLQQDATGSRAVTLPASFKAITGSDTAVQSAANAYTLLHIETFDQGTRWEYSMKGGAA